MFETVLSFGPFVLDPRSMSLQRDGKDVSLSARGVALLEALIEANGGVVDRATLLSRGWAGLAVDESNLTVQMAALRKALGMQPDGREWIATVPRVGYRMVPPAPANGDATESGGRPSIAVLPFANFSADPDQSLFADGLVDDIITGLSRFKTFAVTARNSSFVYGDRAVDAREVGRTLGVRYMLEGSVRRASEAVRISVQLIECGNGAHIWAETFDGPLGDILDFQDRITERAVAAIEPRIRKAEIERSRRKRPENLDAYELYLRAFPLTQGLRREGYTEAVDLLDRALALDPTFAPALAVAGWARFKRMDHGDSSSIEADKRDGLALFERALAAGWDDAVVLAICGFYIHAAKGDRTRGIELMQRALSLNPNSFPVVNLSGYAFRAEGDFDRAIACHLKALNLMPGAPEAIWCLDGLASANLAAGQFEDALVWILRSLDIRGADHWTGAIAAAIYAQLGRLEEAEDALVPVRAAGRTVASFVPNPAAPPPGDRHFAEGLLKAGLAAG